MASSVCRARSTPILLIRAMLVLCLLSLPVSAAAEMRGRLVVIVEPGEGEVQVGQELSQVIGSYVSDFDLVPVTVEHSLPEGTFEEVREVVRAVASAQEADFVVWTRPTREGAVILSVMHILGDTALVRTINLADEPPSTLRRTVAAVVRSVVDTGFLEAASRAEESSPETETGTGTGTEPDPEPERSASTWRFGIDVVYGFRWVSSPGPAYQSVALSLWAGAFDWLGLLLSGRFGPGANPENILGGSARRAGCSMAIGLEHPLGILSLGALVGVDLEWLWGQVELGGDRGQQEFDSLGFGALLRVSLRVRLWRGLELISAVETIVRPERTMFTVQGEPAASSGYVEIGIEIGLGWQIL